MQMWGKCKRSLEAQIQCMQHTCSSANGMHMHDTNA